MLVNVPVETSQAAFGGVAMSARYMASRWSTSVAAGSTGLGSSVTPSKPDSPVRVSAYSWGLYRVAYTVNISGMYSIAYDWLRSARVDFHVASSDCLENCPGVVRSLVERSIAVDGAHTKQLDFGVVCAEKEGVGILGW